jgi:hypothetical protein
MVQFDKVEIREFPIILSNNPSCHYGPSIELGWEYTATNSSDASMKVSQYEKLREGKRRREKAGRPSKLYLSQVRREAMLKDAGYTNKEVKMAAKDKKKARRQRTVNRYLNVQSLVKSHFKVSRTEKKVGRAIRNMERLRRKQENELDSFYDNSAIYSGWWLPFSAHYF